MLLRIRYMVLEHSAFLSQRCINLMRALSRKRSLRKISRTACCSCSDNASGGAKTPLYKQGLFALGSNNNSPLVYPAPAGLFNVQLQAQIRHASYLPLLSPVASEYFREFFWTSIMVSACLSFCLRLLFSPSSSARRAEGSFLPWPRCFGENFQVTLLCVDDAMWLTIESLRRKRPRPLRSTCFCLLKNTGLYCQ